MTQSELAAALQRRKQNRDKLKRYWDTRSYNRLAGQSAAPASRRMRSVVPARIVFALAAAAFFLTGLAYMLF